MGNYEILNSAGQVINTIVADPVFVSKHYDFYREIPSAPEPQIISKLTFRERLTTEEKVAVYTAAETNVMLKVWLDDLAAAEYVTLDHPPLVAGVQYLEAQGIIGEGRAAEILA